MLPEAERWAEGDGVNLKGPLAGIPVSLKDSIVVGGFDVTVGYSINTAKPAEDDGTIVKVLKAAGLSISIKVQQIRIKAERTDTQVLFLTSRPTCQPLFSLSNLQTTFGAGP